MRIWHFAQEGGRALIAILVRYDEEPYYFPNASALLNALPRNAQDQRVIVPQPGPTGWRDADRRQVEMLLHLLPSMCHSDHVHHKSGRGSSTMGMDIARAHLCHENQ